MRRYWIAPSAAIALLAFAPNELVRPTAAAQAAATGGTGAAPQAVVDRYCVVCHNARNKVTAGHLDLTAVEVSTPAQHAEVFEKVVRKLRAGLMPPAGARRPSPAEISSVITYLEVELDRAAEVAPNPGRTEAFHRLNRAEYGNAVRDLLELDVDMTSLLPADDASFGFDNIAGVLKISPSRLERYLAAARKISRAAVGSLLPSPASYEYRVAETMNQYDRIEGLPFGTRGGMLIRHHFPQDGEYEVRAILRCRLGRECDGSAGFADDHRMLVLVDGVEVKSFTLEPRKGDDYRPPTERVWRVPVPVKAGPHDVAVTFVKLPSIREIDSVNQRFLRPYYMTSNVESPHQTIYQPFLDVIGIGGPFSATGVGQTPSRERVFVCYPQGPMPGEVARGGQYPTPKELSCARQIARTLARRAYRRPATTEDVAALLAVFQENAREVGFEAGIEAMLQRLLVSPHFLYRIEWDPPGTVPYRITDLELASRLSFFLWSSIPDELLLAAAERGQLKNPAVLEQQVRRMLADPRADAMVENFAGQWLLLRNLAAHRPDVQLFPNFDDTLRDAARRETELLVAAVLREDRSVLELLTADYTFVNERLARHYGIPGVYGGQFRRVTIPDDHRRGILGHASILVVTSRPNRTSPVIRGKWIIENVLGTPAPEPPPDVPGLAENKIGSRATLPTMRERMIAHRVNPVCAGCHAMLEPSGLALENFDAVGKWRTGDESGAPICQGRNKIRPGGGGKLDHLAAGPRL